MARKLLLLALLAITLASLIPAPAPAIPSLGRACVGTFQSPNDYGCEFTATGARLRVFGVAIGGPGPFASATIWVTATPNPTAEALVTCTTPSLPLASACRKSASTELSGVTLYCWAGGHDRGVFACSS